MYILSGIYTMIQGAGCVVVMLQDKAYFVIGNVSIDSYHIFLFCYVSCFCIPVTFMLAYCIKKEYFVVDLYRLISTLKYLCISNYLFVFNVEIWYRGVVNCLVLYSSRTNSCFTKNSQVAPSMLSLMHCK